MTGLAKPPDLERLPVVLVVPIGLTRDSAGLAGFRPGQLATADRLVDAIRSIRKEGGSHALLHMYHISMTEGKGFARLLEM
jgi:hypothetical protein